MVVANWINMQYFSSAVGMDEYSSGNKTLQNIVGLFGVLEGNSGDLRIGLPFQSIHDGQKLVHEPLRLSVFIEAPYEDIEKIIERNHDISELINNEWIHIFSIDSLSNKIFYRNFNGKYESW